MQSTADIEDAQENQRLRSWQDPSTPPEETGWGETLPCIVAMGEGQGMGSPVAKSLTAVGGGAPFEQAGSGKRFTRGAPPHTANLPGGYLLHPEAKGLWAGQIAIGSLHAHVYW